MAVTVIDCLSSDKLVQLAKVFVYCELARVMTTKSPLDMGTPDRYSPTQFFRQLSMKRGLNNLRVGSIWLGNTTGSSSTILFVILELSPTLLPRDFVTVFAFLTSAVNVPYKQ